MTKRGFTLPEIIIAVAFFGILLGLVTISLFNARSRTVQGATIDILISDLKEQQIKSMSGFNDMSYGIRLEPDKYILFEGDSFISGATTNFEIVLDSSLTISDILLPGSEIVFQNGSGEVLGFVGGQNTFMINSEPGNFSKAVIVNRLGVLDIE
ncbi:MAG: type II secretion system protein [Patescibacteria group bacterium]